ncbi:hypothetical protein Y71_17205 [Kosakonia radicincitans DSM 16656]|uniref:hypothetical protein n=1 Tax=Kosakonia radicincitans TaxID=283686 RepID=UPI000272DF2F|nr:hypothetical protein [Kosakonia radicincitans]ARD61578.1 hypothetical protein Y71_17205 [Kosakonia radicincitans DSM 16656]
MTAQMSRERLEEIKEFGSARIITPINDDEIMTLVDVALAGMDSEPVATLDIQSGRPDGNKFALVYSSAAHRLPDDVYYLYAAPPAPAAKHINEPYADPDFDEPAPVAVPDKWPDCSSAGFGTYDGCITVVTPAGKVVDIDACLVSEVIGLWQRGITTIESCCGHGKASSYIAVIPDDDHKMLALGYVPSTESGAPHVFYSKTSKHGVKDKSSATVPDNRETFEQWWCVYADEPKAYVEGQRTSMGGYYNEFIDRAWHSWQACRAAMQTEPVTPAYTLPPHIYRELVNQLRDTAVKYQGSQQLREQISATLRAVVTPAADSSIPTISGGYTLPDGWKLVPVEPTEEMLNAAWVSHGIYHPSAYRTMLAAAPAAPEQEV